MWKRGGGEADDGVRPKRRAVTHGFVVLENMKRQRPLLELELSWAPASSKLYSSLRRRPRRGLRRRLCRQPQRQRCRRE